jgi:hypothetical protein
MRSARSLVVIGSALFLSVAAQAEPRPFSLYGLAGWEPQTFLGHTPTRYKPVDDGRVQVIEAQCDASASGIAWRDDLDLQETPILAWRWKVETIYPGLNERVEDGDDFPARIFAIRSGGALWWKTKTLVYVWSNGEQGLDDWPSGNTSAAHIIPVRSGGAGVGEWQSERRNVREDFKKYFDLELESLDGIGLMSDCDDHKGKARAWYGDLRLLPE